MRKFLLTVVFLSIVLLTAQKCHFTVGIHLNLGPAPLEVTEVSIEDNTCYFTVSNVTGNIVVGYVITARIYQDEQLLRARTIRFRNVHLLPGEEHTGSFVFNELGESIRVQLSVVRVEFQDRPDWPDYEEF